jgi:hypothetical protein
LGQLFGGGGVMNLARQAHIFKVAKLGKSSSAIKMMLKFKGSWGNTNSSFEIVELIDGKTVKGPQ